ncbi:hypothetical protein COU59_02620 [Candidatus Pacearchaeota archaeon CG10_big_fil_rev_8_21_14_0_10_34_12]|nr:MAG: hypothetical protein COU59_02620 [Candidatus Pacearchaeota archaeon CG10_big_fil_rev_8_21_14_0_10_34_12]
MNKWSELISGVVLLVVLILVSWASAAYTWTIWGKDFNILHAGWLFLKGGLFWFVLMVAFLLIVLGINDLRE